MKKCDHYWMRYFCDCMSRGEGGELEPIHGADIDSFSVCSKCGLISYVNEKNKVVNARPI